MILGPIAAHALPRSAPAGRSAWPAGFRSTSCGRSCRPEGPRPDRVGDGARPREVRSGTSSPAPASEVDKMDALEKGRRGPGIAQSARPRKGAADEATLGPIRHPHQPDRRVERAPVRVMVT